MAKLKYAHGCPYDSWYDICTTHEISSESIMSMAKKAGVTVHRVIDQRTYGDGYRLVVQRGEAANNKKCWQAFRTDVEKLPE